MFLFILYKFFFVFQFSPLITIAFFFIARSFNFLFHSCSFYSFSPYSFNFLFHSYSFYRIFFVNLVLQLQFLIFFKISVIILLIFYFNLIPFIQVFFFNLVLQLQFLICFFSFWSFFFLGPFFEVFLALNFIFQSKFFWFYFFQFNSHSFDLFFLLLNLFFFQFNLSLQLKNLICSLINIFFTWIFSISFCVIDFFLFHLSTFDLSGIRFCAIWSFCFIF